MRKWGQVIFLAESAPLYSGLKNVVRGKIDEIYNQKILELFDKLYKNMIWLWKINFVIKNINNSK